MAPKSAASAPGSTNGPPGSSYLEQPPSGRSTVVGPVATFTRSAKRAPMRAASAAVERTELTEALWTTTRRSGPP